MVDVASCSVPWREKLEIVDAFELWREDGAGLRNLGTGALLNFRGGGPDGDGMAVRGHGDHKPRRAAHVRTSRTHFVLRKVRGRAKLLPP